MSGECTYALHLTAFDIGGLQITLKTKIEEVERRRRAHGDAPHIEEYLGQLKRILAQADAAEPTA